MENVQTIGEYRKDKDINLNKFKSIYPKYYEFIDNFQRKYYNEDSMKFTMGTDFGFYCGIVDYILHNKPKHIVEYGPGFTTVLMHRVSQDLDYELKVTSYENDTMWFDILNKMGCNPFGTMILTDLNFERETEELYYVSYNHPMHEDVDFILIDGPGQVESPKKNGIKRVINTNLHNFEVELDRKINHIIDGRHETQVFYKTEYVNRTLTHPIQLKK
jgi:hypothetical protein